MKEITEKTVIISDYSYDTFKQFLEFQYTNKIDATQLTDVNILDQLVKIGYEYDDEK